MTVVSEPFKSNFDLHLWLDSEGVRQGWRRAKAMGKNWYAHMKRFGGVWYAIHIPIDVLSTTAYILPTRFPQGVDDATRGQLRGEVTVRSSTVADLDAKLDALVAEYRKVGGKRKPRDVSNVTYRPRGRAWEAGELVGREAIKAWQKDVEVILQKEIDSAGQHGDDWTTEGLVGNVLDNYCRKLDTLSRAVQSRYIRTILDSMARRKTILKSDNGRQPRWLSNDLGRV